MYKRTLGNNVELTSIYAKTVIEASKDTQVSYTLKHFPGYGSNKDTHVSSSKDTRTYEEIYNQDLQPFKVGIEEGAEAILISHNIVTSIDNENPASLSKKAHELLRNELQFTGIIITDDLAMTAVSSNEKVTIKAILAGNNIIITRNYKESIEEIKKAIDNEEISEELIDKLVFRILAWKYKKSLM